MSKNANKNKASYGKTMIKSYDLDGLKIEVAEKKPKNIQKVIKKSNDEPARSVQLEKFSYCKSNKRQNVSTNHLVCAICLNFIDADKEVILESCRDIFCCVCITEAIIQNENDIMSCPSKFAACDKEISNHEINEILGADNFKVFLIHKLQSRFNTLVEKDKSDYEGILSKYAGLTPKAQPLRPAPAPPRPKSKSIRSNQNLRQLQIQHEIIHSPKHPKKTLVSHRHEACSLM